MTARSSAGSSKSSASTRASMAAARVHAEAQAAKARLAYAEKKMDIKVEKAQLEATLDLLNLQKEADAAMAKAEVTESVAALYGIPVQGEELNFLPLQTTTEQKVSEYINKHSYTDLAQENRNTFQHEITCQEEQFKQSLMYTPLYVKQEPNYYPNHPPDGAKQPQQKDEITTTAENKFKQC